MEWNDATPDHFANSSRSNWAPVGVERSERVIDHYNASWSVIYDIYDLELGIYDPDDECR